MLFFFLAIATLNLLMGMGVAIVVSNDPHELNTILRKLPLPFLKRFLPPEEQHSAHEHSPETHHATPGAESHAHALDIPHEWKLMLKPHTVRPRTLWEAVLCCLRLQLLQHLPKVIACERKLRPFDVPDTKENASGVLSQTELEYQQWLEWLRATVKWMSQRRATMGVTEEQESVLEEKLQDRLQQAEVVLRLLGKGSEKGALQTAVHEALLELNRDLVNTHALVDLTLESLSQVFAGEQRWPELSVDWLYDTHTGLKNRLGLKSVVHEWLQADPQRMRLMSLMFVECDRLSRWNERLGVSHGDDLFRAFAQRVSNCIRKDRGDRAIRFGGGTIAVLLADAGAAGGRCAAERIRQTIESTIFQLGTEELTLTANCSVTEYFLDDALPEVIRRLQEGMKEAKKAGRNRTAIDEGNGPKVFEALPMTIPGTTVRVDAPTETPAAAQ
jgi:diguanylate cyclase